MARDVTGDVTGGGPDSYDGDPDVRTPALGRSSRDLASDTGPAGASDEQFGAGDRDTELLSGQAPDEGGEGRFGRKRERHPEIDPDTRMGLHPTLAPGDVKEPAVDAETPSSSSSKRVL